MGQYDWWNKIGKYVKKDAKPSINVFMMPMSRQQAETRAMYTGAGPDGIVQPDRPAMMIQGANGPHILDEGEVASSNGREISVTPHNQASKMMQADTAVATTPEIQMQMQMMKERGNVPYHEGGGSFTIDPKTSLPVGFDTSNPVYGAGGAQPKSVLAGGVTSDPMKTGVDYISAGPSGAVMNKTVNGVDTPLNEQEQSWNRTRPLVSTPPKDISYRDAMQGSTNYWNSIMQGKDPLSAAVANRATGNYSAQAQSQFGATTQLANQNPYLTEGARNAMMATGNRDINVGRSALQSDLAINQLQRADTAASNVFSQGLQGRNTENAEYQNAYTSALNADDYDTAAALYQQQYGRPLSVEQYKADLQSHNSDRSAETILAQITHLELMEPTDANISALSGLYAQLKSIPGYEDYASPDYSARSLEYKTENAAKQMESLGTTITSLIAAGIPPDDPRLAPLLTAYGAAAKDWFAGQNITIDPKDIAKALAGGNISNKPELAATFTAKLGSVIGDWFTNGSGASFGSALATNPKTKDLWNVVDNYETQKPEDVTRAATELGAVVMALYTVSEGGYTDGDPILINARKVLDAYGIPYGAQSQGDIGNPPEALTANYSAGTFVNKLTPESRFADAGLARQVYSAYKANPSGWASNYVIADKPVDNLASIYNVFSGQDFNNNTGKMILVGGKPYIIQQFTDLTRGGEERQTYVLFDVDAGKIIEQSFAW